MLPVQFANPQSPNLAQSHDQIIDNNNGAGQVVPAIAAHARPHYTALAVLPAVIYIAQEYRQALGNITFVGPYINLFLQYTPSLQETWTLSYPVALVKVGFGSWVHGFGGNPVAENIFRDVPKAYSVVRARFSGLDLGSSGYKYGWGNVATAVIKPVCKTAFILRSPNRETGGLMANFVCEPLAHATSLIERDLQDISKAAVLNSTFPQYLELVSQNTDIVGLTARSAMAVPSKAVVPKMFMDFVWIRFGMNVALAKATFSSAVYIQTLIVRYATGNHVAFLPKDGIYKHMRLSYRAAEHYTWPVQLLIAATPIITNVGPALVTEFYNTFILMSILRPMQYATDWATLRVANLAPAWSQPLLEPFAASAILSGGSTYFVSKLAEVSTGSVAKVAVPVSLAIVALDAGFTYLQLQPDHVLAHTAVGLTDCAFVMSFILPTPLVALGICVALSAMWHYNAQTHEQEEIAPSVVEINSKDFSVAIAGEQPQDNVQQVVAA